MSDGFWGAGAWLVGFVALQRLAELIYAGANSRRLLRTGGMEFGRAHYPVMVALHLCWLLAVFFLGHARPVALPWLVIFIFLQAARLWVIATLGPRWTTRIIVVPGEAVIRRGPYRWFRHPNYLIVTLEIAVVPLALGLWGVAIAFSAANAAMLYRRIRVENAALNWAETTRRADIFDKAMSALANAASRR